MILVLGHERERKKLLSSVQHFKAHTQYDFSYSI